MRDALNADGQSIVVIFIWLVAGGAGIGLYGQGHLLLALLAIGLIPVASILSVALMRAGMTLLAPARSSGASARPVVRRRVTAPRARRRPIPPPYSSTGDRRAPTCA